MRTIFIIAAGFALLLTLVFVIHLVSRANREATAKAALAFLPVWFTAAAYNMWVGVSHAGYSVLEEAPIFAIIFALPAVLAVFLWRRFSTAS